MFYWQYGHTHHFEKGRPRDFNCKNTGDDFWSCDPQDLVSGNKAYFQSSVSQLYLFAEKRRRAAEAYELCAKLRHPGDQAVIAALDGGCFGACLACAESIMRASSAPVSQSEPARCRRTFTHRHFSFLRQEFGRQHVFAFCSGREIVLLRWYPHMSSKSSKNVLVALT